MPVADPSPPRHDGPLASAADSRTDAEIARLQANVEETKQRLEQALDNISQLRNLALDLRRQLGEMTLRWVDADRHSVLGQIHPDMEARRTAVRNQRWQARDREG